MNTYSLFAMFLTTPLLCSEQIDFYIIYNCKYTKVRIYSNFEIQFKTSEGYFKICPVDSLCLNAFKYLDDSNKLQVQTTPEYKW